MGGSAGGGHQRGKGRLLSLMASFTVLVKYSFAKKRKKKKKQRRWVKTQRQTVWREGSESGSVGASQLERNLK